MQVSGGPGRPGRPNAPVAAPRHEVWAVDHDFAAWPLDDPAVLAALGTWLRRPGRRLILLGLDYERTAKALPRFARWRRDWAHAIDCWRPADGQMPAGLRGLVTGDVVWQWQDARDALLQAHTDPAARLAFGTALADFLQRCEPAWPVTTLGL